jgi:hypothetical protein
MSAISVDGRSSRHSSFCHLDSFHYTPLPVLSDDPFVRGNWIGCVGDLDRECEFVHLRLLFVGRIARMFTLRLNSLFVLETRDIINPL